MVILSNDNGETRGLSSFGESNYTESYGQVIKIPQAGFIYNFSFFTKSAASGTTTIKAFIYIYNRTTNKVGNKLYESDKKILTTSTNYEKQTETINESVAVNQNDDIIFFFSSTDTNFNDLAPSGETPNFAFQYGADSGVNNFLVYNNNNWITTAWTERTNSELNYEIEIQDTPPAPVASACFLKDTIIKTDSGNEKIQDIKEEKHSINGKKIKALTKTFYAKKGDNIPPFLVSIPKGALFKNSPDKETFVSPLHSVFYHGQLVYAKDLVLMDKASPVNYNYKDHVYDILLDTHEKMVANNMIVETLDPESITGRFYRHFVINKKATSEEKALAKTILYEFNNFYWNECLNHPKINPEKKQHFDEAVYKKFLLTCKTSEKKKIFKSLV
jgi:hypothetical protein